MVVAYQYKTRSKVAPRIKSHTSTSNIDNGRDRLIDAAITLFSKRGYEGVSINEIGREAGVTSQLIYHYFDNGKRGLYCEAYLKAFRHMIEVSVRDLPADPDLTDPNARLIAVQGIATFIRNIVTAAGNALDPRENDIVLLGYRETFELPLDLREEIMEQVWISVTRIRNFLKILVPNITPFSLSLMATAVTGPLYHERVITGIQLALRNGIHIPAEKKADFFIAYTLRMIGIDRDLPSDHPYCYENLNKFLFSLT